MNLPVLKIIATVLISAGLTGRNSVVNPGEDRRCDW
jgi:hypothetical protein